MDTKLIPPLSCMALKKLKDVCDWMQSELIDKFMVKLVSVVQTPIPRQLDR